MDSRNPSTVIFNGTPITKMFEKLLTSSIGSGLDASTSIIPISIRYFIALINSESGILLSDHHPAVFRTQSGIIFSGPGGPGSVAGIKIIPSLIRNSRPLVNSL